MLKLTTDNHEASRSISATAELLVIARQDFSTKADDFRLQVYRT